MTGPWALELTDGEYGDEGGGREGKGSWGRLAGVQLGQLGKGGPASLSYRFLN